MSKDLWSPQPFDMSSTIRHPGVMYERIKSVIEQISYHRVAIEAREIELAQLNGIVYEMLGEIQ